LWARPIGERAVATMTASGMPPVYSSVTWSEARICHTP
jgi:hypothetical protein